MKSRWSLSLGRLFAVTLAALVVLLGLLFALLLGGTQQSILEISERMRRTAAGEIAGRVETRLRSAEVEIDRFTTRFRASLIDTGDPAAVEAAFYAEFLGREKLDELSFTWASSIGYDDGGDIMLAPGRRGQISVYRAPGGNARGDALTLFTRLITIPDSGPVLQCRKRPPGGGLLSAPLERELETPSDPTQHLTFKTPARRDFRGRLLWSDLHWSEQSAHMPESGREVVVTLQRSIEDSAGRFIGVLRVGLLTGRLDEIARIQPYDSGQPDADTADPHRVFLCDARGRLVSSVTPADHLEDSDGDLRFVSPDAPPQVVAALHAPVLAGVAAGQPPQSVRLKVNGTTYLATFQPLQRTQDWIVAIVVPESYYLGNLTATRNRLLIASFAVMAVILVGGVFTLRLVRGGLTRITGQAAAMTRFSFEPAEARSGLTEVRLVLDSIEGAKAALRAMSRYVPIDLVRQLYARDAEPKLGGEPRDLTVMFTDIQGFTDLAERLPPDRLAEALGLYLDAMTQAVHENGGVIDKFIGDAVMAMWNAPKPVEDHAVHGCAAALACLRFTAELYRSPAWHGLPPLVTRIGLHKDRVLVGHFGAPSRMNYTALGDGVNTAARLESLNRYYGTMAMVTAAVEAEARGRFVFRRLDRVAVKGKTKGFEVFELIGEVGQVNAAESVIRNYEAALEMYRRRQFSGAINLLNTQTDDAPSRVLIERCVEFLREPPPGGWDGTWVFTLK
ncbi:MAG: adenylate/guanylate cyclase domain-containing protein [Planctomycetes bacterium]|nr:adenylate/guanylate cyclase domain-containing protein [Planctomycetota bacterium]